ncbi:NAD(P)H-binding protein [Trinickia sp. LjRoot230]|uniref:NmrA family NAD(P)-binding protein n=1 Tax=Trinickia sp. LjRoot230 TaxID=3342288 RepID=UPI003ECE4094
MFVIFGASGNVGRATIAALRAAGKPVRAVVRNPTQGERFAQDGCELALADLSDAGSIAQALKGAQAVQMLCPVPRGDAHPDETMLRTIDAVTSALSEKPPARLLALSDYGAQIPSGTGITSLFHVMEQRWRDIAGHTIMLRAAEHMHNWARVMPAALATGRLPSLHHPLTKRFPTVAAADVGRAAAELLLDEAHTTPLRIVSIESRERVDAVDVARALSDASGIHVNAYALERGDWEAALARAGLTAAHARLIIELYDAHNAGNIDIETGVTERRFGATTLAEVFAQIVPPIAVARSAT